MTDSEQGVLINTLVTRLFACWLMCTENQCPQVAGAGFCLGKYSEMLKSGCFAVTWEFQQPEITTETVFLPVISIYWQIEHWIVGRRFLLGKYKLSFDTLTNLGGLDRESREKLLSYENNGKTLGASLGVGPSGCAPLLQALITQGDRCFSWCTEPFTSTES